MTAEPRPDINIKVATFTVSEKSSNMNVFAHMDKRATFPLVEEGAADAEIRIINHFVFV